MGGVRFPRTWVKVAELMRFRTGLSDVEQISLKDCVGNMENRQAGLFVELGGHGHEHAQL